MRRNQQQQKQRPYKEKRNTDLDIGDLLIESRLLGSNHGSPLAHHQHHIYISDAGLAESSVGNPVAARKFGFVALNPILGRAVKHNCSRK
jgi:hypothetical protein